MLFARVTWKAYQEAKQRGQDWRSTHRLFQQPNTAIFIAAQHGWPAMLMSLWFGLRSVRLFLADGRLYIALPFGRLIGLGRHPIYVNFNTARKRDDTRTRTRSRFS